MVAQCINPMHYGMWGVSRTPHVKRLLSGLELVGCDYQGHKTATFLCQGLPSLVKPPGGS